MKSQGCIEVTLDLLKIQGSLLIVQTTRMCPLDLASDSKYINLYEVEALLNAPRKHFPFNVFGDSKYSSFWGVKVTASERKKKVRSLKGLTPFMNICFLMTGKFLYRKKMTFGKN